MRTIRDLLAELVHIRKRFVLAVLTYLIATTSLQLLPLLLKSIVDSFLRPVSQGQPLDAEELLKQLGLYLFLVVWSAIFAYLASRLLHHCSNRIVQGLRQRAYEVMQNLPIAYFDDKPAGQIATRIVNDTETLRSQFYDTIVVVLTASLKLLFIYGVLFYVNAHMGVVLLVLIPVFYGVQFCYKRLTDQPVKDFYDARSQVNTQVHEVMHGVSLLQLYGQEAVALSTFEATADEMRRANQRIIWAQSIAGWPLTEWLRNMVVALVLALVGFQFLDGHASVTVGELFLYLNYLLDIFDLLGMLTRRYPNIQRSLETGRRVLDLLHQEQELDVSNQLSVSSGQVTFEDVGFAYIDGQPVLEEITVQVEPGETVALVGHTGSGKSSMMNLLYRFYEPSQGRICIDGQDISCYSRESLRRHMGIVLQDPYLFTGTIASNVSMGQENAKDEDIRSALEKVGAAPLLTRLEKGIHEPVVEKGAAFSSGERQLIAFARTLFANPKLLILDEATSHIDTETEELIQKALAVLKEGRTTFIIAHRLSTIQHADQILVLDRGRIVERGTHEQLLAQEGKYAQLHQIQQTVV